MESKPGDHYLGSWKPHGLNDIEIPNTGKTVCGINMDLVPARARILLSIKDFVISVSEKKQNRRFTYA
jgi:hypothetical protein